jgi:hypothetical protein
MHKSKNLYQNPIGFQDLYDLYCNSTKQKDRLTVNEVHKIIYTLNTRIVDEILDGKILKLPYQLGTLRIRKVKMNFKKQIIHSNRIMIQEGKKEIITNAHTNFHYFRWQWKCNKEQFTKSQYFMFLPTRENKAKLRNRIMNNNYTYEL